MRSLSSFACSIVSALIVLSVSPSAAAQGSAVYGKDNPRFDVALGFQHIHANAPPASCQCFGMNGGFLDAKYWMRPRFGITAEVSGAHRSDISTLGQNLTLTTFMAGPHVAFPFSRVTPYYDVLVGGAHGSDSYFPTGNSYTTSASTFAFATGGGIDVDLNRRFSIRVIQARYLHTSFPNGTNNEQNQLMVGAGIVARFGHKSRWESAKPAPPAPPAPEPPPVVAVAPPPPPPPPTVSDFACTATRAEVAAGTTVEVASVVQTSPQGGMVSYSWTASGGRVLGNGERVTVDTTGLPPGEYHVTGRASLADPSAARTCDIAFRIMVPPTPAEVRKDEEQDFRANMQDIFFDLNKSNLTSESLAALQHDAEYLNAHPRIRISVGGFADQRGSSRYNLALGERRAASVKAELIRLGVTEDRIKVVTFGRDAQTCTAGNEDCWRRNRRVGFLMQP